MPSRFSVIELMCCQQVWTSFSVERGESSDVCNVFTYMIKIHLNSIDVFLLIITAPSVWNKRFSVRKHKHAQSVLRVKFQVSSLALVLLSGSSSSWFCLIIKVFSPQRKTKEVLGDWTMWGAVPGVIPNRTAKANQPKQAKLIRTRTGPDWTSVSVWHLGVSSETQPLHSSFLDSSFMRNRVHGSERTESACGARAGVGGPPLPSSATHWRFGKKSLPAKSTNQTVLPSRLIRNTHEPLLKALPVTSAAPESVLRPPRPSSRAVPRQDTLSSVRRLPETTRRGSSRAAGSEEGRRGRTYRGLMKADTPPPAPPAERLHSAAGLLIRGWHLQPAVIQSSLFAVLNVKTSAKMSIKNWS